MMGRFTLALAAVLAASPCAAQETLFDASNPAEVARVLRDAGYKAELKKGSDGDPYIASAANGSSFSIIFYGCESEKACPSFQFYSFSKKDPLFTSQFVNDWNTQKRFLKLRIDEDGDLAQSIDVTTVGKMTTEAFADWVDWYSTMDGELSKFITARRTAAGTKK